MVSIRSKGCDGINLAFDLDSEPTIDPSCLFFGRRGRCLDIILLAHTLEISNSRVLPCLSRHCATARSKRYSLEHKSLVACFLNQSSKLPMHTLISTKSLRIGELSGKFSYFRRNVWVGTAFSATWLSRIASMVVFCRSCKPRASSKM